MFVPIFDIYSIVSANINKGVIRHTFDLFLHAEDLKNTPLVVLSYKSLKSFFYFLFLFFYYYDRIFQEIAPTIVHEL